MAKKSENAGEPRPRSGQITFVTGVHYRKKTKTLYVTKRKLTFKNGVLIEVGGTTEPEEINLLDTQEKKE